MRNSILVICFFTLLAHSTLCAQGRKFPTPPAPADRTVINQRTDETTPRQRLDLIELQRESRELSDLARTVPADVESVSHGLLPKDFIEKLKRIEKLSKHLRSEVTR